MIGDWVKVHFGEPNETIGNDMYGPVAELYDDGRIEVAFKDAPSVLWNIEKERGDDILPVPLTPEILEKNGCKRYDEAMRRDGLYKYEIGSSRCIVVFDINSVKKPFIDCENATCRMQREIIYVHELQHALRLCGIDKTITL